MTLAEALDILDGRPGYARFRSLCADNNPDVEQRDAYRTLAARLASGAPQAVPATPVLAIEPDIPPEESIPASLCPHRIIPECRCEYGQCGKYSRHTTLSLCVDCRRAGLDG